jgi:hypothetical protein
VERVGLVHRLHLPDRSIHIFGGGKLILRAALVRGLTCPTTPRARRPVARAAAARSNLIFTHSEGLREAVKGFKIRLLCPIGR